jgi:hypothetical protein
MNVNQLFINAEANARPFTRNTKSPFFCVLVQSRRFAATSQPRQVAAYSESLTQATFPRQPQQGGWTSNLPIRRTLKEDSMRSLLLCLILACTASVLVMAGDNDTKGKSDTRTVTGCLQKTDHANEFLLKANDGSSWDLKSSTVSLAPHVGHTITATGTVSNKTAHNLKEDTKDMAHDTGMKKSNAEHGDLKVTDVQMVSDSCTP